MNALPAYAGIIVSRIERSVAWYADVLGVEPGAPQDGWVTLPLGDGSTLELVAGDLGRPGLSFPSYGREQGPPVMAGYSVEDPDAAADGLEVVVVRLSVRLQEEAQVEKRFREHLLGSEEQCDEQSPDPAVPAHNPRYVN
jgi:catechol 2,3-dioxygenase-like lactoylglutathione lyase family enzyme